MKETKKQYLAVVCCLGLAACNAEDGASRTAPETQGAESTVSAPSAAIPDFAAWEGMWTGPEGLFVEVQKSGEGSYSLEMQSDLDTRGSYEGRATEQGIEFERAGETHLLRAAAGDQTGLKYLAGKQDCLMVAEGEGYCRD